MAKRKLTEDCNSFSGADIAESANINGVLTSVSPKMKQGKRAKYFEGKLTDGEKQLRIVGFREGQRSTLAEYQKKNAPVTLLNCELKRDRQSEELEVLLKSSWHHRPQKFEISDIAAIATSELKLEALGSRNTYDKDCLSAKVLRVQDPEKVSGGITKQDITIADVTSAGRLTLWEDDIGRMQKGKSYRLTNVVCCFQMEKYLSLPKEGAVLAEISDIGEVAEDDLADEYTTIADAEVVGVVSINSYLACIACKCKVETTNEKLGK